MSFHTYSEKGPHYILFLYYRYSMYNYKKLPKDFKRKLQLPKFTGCWEFIQLNDRNRPQYKGMVSYRYTYKFFVGSIPEGLVPDHLCKNKVCCNPSHLEMVLPSENARRFKAAPYSCLWDKLKKLKADKIYCEGACDKTYYKKIDGLLSGVEFILSASNAIRGTSQGHPTRHSRLR